MQDEKKKKLTNILVYIALGVVILFCVITSIILNFKNKEYEDLNNKNEEYEQIVGDNTDSTPDNSGMILVVDEWL